MLKISDEQYFADPSLNCGGVKQILKGTPAHFNQKLGIKDCFVEGRGFHHLALEPHNTDNEILVAEESKKRTSAQIQQGYLKFKSAQEIIKWAESLRDYLWDGYRLGDIFDNCEIEMSHFWVHDFGDFQVPCKIKIDAINHKHKIIIDAKSAKDASRAGFSKALFNKDLAYYIQDGFYTLPPELEDYKFYFACVEKTAPYCTGLWQAPACARAKARREIEVAARIYNHGITTGIWSKQYNNGPEIIPAPKWFKGEKDE